MILNNNLNEKLGTLSAILDEYLAWVNGVTRSVFYEAETPQEPKSFIEWLEACSIEPINIDGQYLDQKEGLLKRHKQLISDAGALGTKPEAEAFAQFVAAAQDYISDLRCFGQAIALEEWGLDVLTGLKNNAVVKKDLAIEMERLSREGYPFCVGLARIDEFEQIQKALGHDTANEMVKTVAGLVQQSLRSYDDAYRISRDHYIMCLKQSDIVGGQKALERLRDILEKAGEVYEIDGQERPLSLSCCVAAPLPGDDIDDLLDNLNVDLDTQIKDAGSVLTYQELSPLQRFIQKEKD